MKFLMSWMFVILINCGICPPAKAQTFVQSLDAYERADYATAFWWI